MSKIALTSEEFAVVNGAIVIIHPYMLYQLCINIVKMQQVSIKSTPFDISQTDQCL
jgi:hypothetical protein